MLSPFLKINKLLLKNSNTLLTVVWNCKICEISRIIFDNNRWQQYSSVSSHLNMSQEGVGLSLKDVLERLTKIAPLSLAESWDNVGLLVEPSTPKLIKKVFLTNDLTERVFDEALLVHTDFILSYHPPIFVPLKSVTTKTWKERVILKCIENKIAVFSPHTSYDSVQDGVTDWMSSVFGSDCNVTPLILAKEQVGFPYTVEIFFANSPAGNSAADSFLKQTQQFGSGNGEKFPYGLKELTEKETKVSMPCNSSTLPQLVKIFHNVRNGSENEYFKILKHEQVPNPLCGAGRLCTLKQPLEVGKIVEMVKSHIHLSHVRLALVPGKGMDAPISTVAICVGSGSSVLKGVKADLYLTGEMLHHDILDAVHNGSHVILCNHSDSERGFLSVLASKLEKLFQGAVEVLVSKEDRDPLKTV